MKLVSSKSTAISAVLFFFTALCSIYGADEKFGNLTITEVELSSIVEAFSKKYKKVILPNDGLLSSLKPRKAKVIIPTDLGDMQQNDELWDQIYSSILSMYSYALVKKGDVYRLVPSKDTAKMPTPIINDEGYVLNEKSERIVTRVIVLKHVVSDVVRPMFRYIQDVTTPLALPDKKTLVITASESSIKYFLDLIKIFDVPLEKPYVKVYHLERALASNVRTHLQAYFNIIKTRKKGAVDASQAAYLLPDDTTNRLLISAIEEEHKLAASFIEFFDADVDIKIPPRPIQIYRLQNSDADSIAKKLDQVLKAKRSTKTPVKGAKVEDIPTIVPFEELNALIISVEEPETFQYVKEVIELLDVKRNQVYISSTIVEVSNNDNFSFGMIAGAGTAPTGGSKFGLLGGTATGVGTAGSVTFDGTSGNPSITPDITTNGLGLAIPYGGIDFIPFVLKAAQDDSDINVLANPSIICDDNEHAVIEITTVRSFNNQTIGNSGTSTTSRGNEEAGLVLDIKPTISSDSFLKLEIVQNVDRFLADEADSNNTNRLKRRATTIVTIPNKTSVVIGGLTEQSSNRSSNKVPVLHKIPLLGELFKSRSKSNENQTLYFFITPEIITNFEELSNISDDLHDRMSSKRNEDINDNPLFREVRNSQDVYLVDNVLTPLQAAFNEKDLKKWVHKDQAPEFAIALIKNSNQQVDELLPEFTQAFFNSSNLDWKFENALSMADGVLSEMEQPLRITICSAFRQHLVATLQKIKPSFSYGSSFKKKKAATNHVKIELPAKD